MEERWWSRDDRAAILCRGNGPHRSHTQLESGTPAEEKGGLLLGETNQIHIID